MFCNGYVQVLTNMTPCCATCTLPRQHLLYGNQEQYRQWTAFTLHSVIQTDSLSGRLPSAASWCREQEDGKAYPAVHDKLNALPLELLCGIDGNLAIIGAQDMVMGVHQPHSHNVLSRRQQRLGVYAERVHVKLQHKAGNTCKAVITILLLHGLSFMQIEL